MLEKFLKRSNWTDVTVSIVFAFLGILLMVRPNEMVSVVAILLGAVFVIAGFLKLVDYFTSGKKEDYLLTLSLIFMIIGAIILLKPSIISNIFNIVLGVWMIVIALENFQTTLLWKEHKSNYWTATVCFSLLMILAGITIVVNNNLGIKIMGLIITIYAVLDIATRAIFIKKIKDYLK